MSFKHGDVVECIDDSWGPAYVSPGVTERGIYKYLTVGSKYIVRGVRGLGEEYLQLVSDDNNIYDGMNCTYLVRCFRLVK